jgi:hypothetical protein
MAIQVFGVDGAAHAMMTLGYLLECLGKADLESAIPDLLSDKVKTLESQLLVNMQADGLNDKDLYVGHIDSWCKAARELVENGEPTVERLGYDPVNLGSAFHLGKLYYPVQTLVRTEAFTSTGHKRNSEQIDVVVVRSDRTLQHVSESEDAQGRKSGIIRLTDGMLLQKRPTASPNASWSWDAIERYLASDYPKKPLQLLIIKAHRHLRSKVWLPDEDDYWLLACAVITSYTQAIFDAVPLILLTGEGGTGKSELGTGMTEISCNSTMIAQSSPSAMLRKMDEAMGLVVIDDLESIGAKSGQAGKEKFSEMVQLLKVSYKKTSATKIVTNTRRKAETMNFFGVKIVSNTQGVDAILGSRMLQVGTSSIPKNEVDPFLARQGLHSDDINQLRNDLHIWAFDNVELVNAAYQDAVKGSAARDEEIAAPLRVIAKLAMIPEAQEALERALGNQATRKAGHASPEEALKQIMDKMVLEGAIKLSIIEISLHLRRAMGIKINPKQKLIWMQPEWISKKIRSMGYIDASAGRKNLFGFQMRIVSISNEKRLELQAFNKDSRDPYGFCAGCTNCPFKSKGCEILPYRVRKEGLI